MENIFDMETKHVKSGIGSWFEPAILDLFPQQFDAVKVWAVRRQEEQAQPAPFPLGLFFAHTFGARISRTHLAR